MVNAYIDYIMQNKVHNHSSYYKKHQVNNLVDNKYGIWAACYIKDRLKANIGYTIQNKVHNHSSYYKKPQVNNLVDKIWNMSGLLYQR